MANKKITQLDALTSAAAAEGDVLPIVDLDADQTKKIQLGDLKSGSFVGTSTGLAGSPSIVVSSITASGDISSSATLTGDRINATSYVQTPQIQNLPGIELLSNSGPITITGSGAVGLKTTDASTGGVDISSAKDFTNTVGGAYHLTATGGIRITGSGGGAHPLELESGLEDGVFVRGGNAGINLISSTNTIINSTGNVEITGSGANGVRISSSKFTLQGSGNSEITMGGAANFNLNGSPLGDVTLNAGLSRTLFLQSEGGTVSADAATVLLKDSTVANQIHLSSSAIHIMQEVPKFIFNSQLPTTEPTQPGELWLSGSGYGSASGSKYLMMKT
jgi:hypothetical protein